MLPDQILEQRNEKSNSDIGSGLKEENGEIERKDPAMTESVMAMMARLKEENERLKAENAKLKLASEQGQSEKIARIVEGNDQVVPQDEHPRLTHYTADVADSMGREDAEYMCDDVTAMWKRVEYVLQQPMSRNRAYGLAVGRVQSGKTQNYIGLILRAIDAGWNTIILLTSKNRLLAKQTNDRIMACFQSLKLVVNPLSQPPNNGDGVQFNPSAAWSPVSVNFGMALKDHNHIEWVKQWLHHSQAEHHRMKVLIVDDESDNATPDGRQVGGVRFENDAEVRRVADELNVWHERSAGLAAQWVMGLIGENFSLNDEQKKDIRNFCEHTTSRAIREGLLDNASVLQSLGFTDANGDFCEVNNCHLFDSVMRYFCRSRPNKNPDTMLFGKAFIALLRYVADYRPSHSVINAAMRVIAGRPCDALGMPANDIRSFEYGKMVYIAYTATPYANLLNEDPMRDPLAPDFIMALKTSRKYIGFDRIFGRRPMNIIGEISAQNANNEVLLLEDFDEDRVRHVDTKTLTFTVNDISVEWTSLKRALAWFVCTAAARRVYRMRGSDVSRGARWTTMILNVSFEKGDHNALVNWVTDYLNANLSKERRTEFRDGCLAVWRELKASFSVRDFLDACELPYPGMPQDYPTDDELKTSLDWFFDRHDDHIKVVQINSDGKGRDGAVAYYDDTQLRGHDIAWVLCGGNVISRGLTLEGLTTSYFNRVKDSTAVDTITQMGRWFGYRMGYELLPRIWMTADSKAEMCRFCRIEARMHNMLQSLFYQSELCYDNEGNEIGERPLSPVLDRDSFGFIISFGRVLSGRSNAARYSMPPGLSSIRGSLDEFVGDLEVQTAAKEVVTNLCNQLSADYAERRLVREETSSFGERYHKFPYWHNVDSLLVRNVLEAIATVYPEGSESARNLGSLLYEINHTGDHRWDVVFANPQTRMVVPDVLDGSLHGHLERPTELIGGRVLAFKRSHTTATGFFANVSVRDVNLGECALVEEYAARDLLTDLKETLGGLHLSLAEELRRVRENPIEKLHALVRGHRLFNFSRNSHLKQEYIDKVFEIHQRNLPVSANPILLIDFVKPDGIDYEKFGFYPVLSYYWPGHAVTEDYMLVTAGGSVQQAAESQLAPAKPHRNKDEEESFVMSTKSQSLSGSTPDGLVERIREIIRNNRLISEISIMKEIVPRSESEIADYMQAMQRFTPINEGLACDHTPLSRRNRVFADSQWLNNISGLRKSCPERYFRELNNLIEELVVKDLKDDCEGMCQTEFSNLLQKKFPGVFSVDEAVDCFWERYEQLYGPCERPEVFSEELSPAEVKGIGSGLEDDL